MTDVISENTQIQLSLQAQEVIIHPLVLLSVVDHYQRVAKGTKKRVVGCLLGTVHKGRVDVTNSFAIPFEEDSKDPSIWFLDFSYHEKMASMFKKVNASERIVGWYSTGPKIRACDMDIQQQFTQYTRRPVFCIIDVNPPDDFEIPIQSYVSVQNPSEEGSQDKYSFVHLPSDVGAFEPEEVGVEHLLSDIRGADVSTLQDKVSSTLNSLKGLHKRVGVLRRYIEQVVTGEVPANHEVFYNMQNIFNWAPDVSVESLRRAFAIDQNDRQAVLYLGALVRTVLSLDKLVRNRVSLESKRRETEKQKLANEEKSEDGADSDKQTQTETSKAASGKKGASAKKGGGKK